jgi:hypothetical protein
MGPADGTQKGDPFATGDLFHRYPSKMSEPWGRQWKSCPPPVVFSLPAPVGRMERDSQAVL